MEKPIKNVNEESWHELKSEAMQHGMKISTFLELLIREHKRNEEKKVNAWGYVLSGKKKLSDADAASIKDAISTFENEYNFE